jgi:hypothetical protein
MIKAAGRVWGRANVSYVYVIVIDSHIYIGETGGLPPIRWAQHLSKEGTLASKLLALGMEPPGTDEILFVCVRCTLIDSLKPNMQKRARRLIEEELHRQFCLDARMLGEEFKIVSEPPPPSVRFTWTFDSADVARRIRAHVAKEFESWKKETSSTI